MRQIFAVCLVVLTGLFSTPVLAQDNNKINLRLFGKSVLDGYNGCSFALWQRNRNPDRDKFAYVFYIRFHDAHPMPALVKIGRRVLELEKVEIGVKDSGLSDKFQLYREPGGKTTLLVEIKKEHRKGDFTVVDEARLTFIQRGKFPFVMKTKGGFRCPKKNKRREDDRADEPVEESGLAAPVRKPKAPASSRLVMPRNLDRNAIRLSGKKTLSSLKQFPRHVLKVVRDNGEACNLNNVPGYGEKYAISPAMTLWVVPCDLFTSTATFMLVTSLNGTRHAIGMEIPKRPGKSGAPGYDLLSPKINPSKGIVSVLSMGRQGDCGTLEHYQLVLAEGEAVELKLLEVREKNDCNGKKVNPNRLPLVYRAR